MSISFSPSDSPVDDTMNSAVFKDVLVTCGIGWRHCLQQNLELIQGLMEAASVLESGPCLSPFSRTEPLRLPGCPFNFGVC